MVKGRESRLITQHGLAAGSTSAHLQGTDVGFRFKYRKN
jgi:hypothetical protein